MKTVIVALNSKYIHSSLAPWYLKAYCGSECGEIDVKEYTINHSLDMVLASICGEKPDITAFSCYIWNISDVLKIAQNLKKISPHTKIVLGGPEVSFDGEKIMVDNPCIDYVIQGEGENSFRLILKTLLKKEKESGRGVYAGVDEIKGLSYRDGEKVISNDVGGFIEDLDSIPSPYTDEMLARFGNRIVYFESSRGCPFSCSYCLSSTFEGVRNFSVERVRRDLSKLIEAGVKQIKFVDRTFNCNKKRAKEIFKFVIDKGGDTNFHFEAAADLFDDEMLDMLSKAPKGRIQFEIGIQTTNKKTLEAINRKTDLNKVFHNINRLINMKNIHIHLDLIAGLPFEDFASFRNSFNDVYRLSPHQLQLGFLKMLKGSRIREEAENHKYEFREYPPYEVLCNTYITYGQITELKGIEEMVERYYNSGRFKKSLAYVIQRYYSSAFDFYSSFQIYNSENGCMDRSISARETYTVLFEFIKKTVPQDDLQLINELLKLDYLSSNNSNNLPEGIHRKVYPGFKEQCFEFLKDENNIRSYLPEFKGLPAKQIYKLVHFEIFDYEITGENTCKGFENKKTVVLFNYSSRDSVTGLYDYLKVMHSNIS